MDLQLIILIFFAVTAAFLSLYYLLFLRFALAKKPMLTEPNFPVSVIVVGRNEAKNFKKNLPLLCQQDFNQFEVVAVNDQSIDDSIEVIEELQKEYANLRLVNVAENDRFYLGKKYGLTLGIKAASYDQLLLTDADCVPASPKWISNMMSPMTSKALILGYGKYEFSNHLVNLFIQFETVHTAIQYFSYALLGMPYMGVGRNMAYHRQLFFDNKGFVSHMNIMSGDDDLFVQQAATRKNVAVVFQKEAHTLSAPKTSFKEWFRQKQRHYKTSKFYKPSHKFALGFYGFLQPLFYAALVLTFMFTPFWKEALIITGVKIFLQYLVFVLSTLKLGSYRILWVLPLLELLTWLLQFYAYLLSAMRKKPRW